MVILVLMSLTLCLTLVDIVLKSYVEGFMAKGEERTICKGKVKLRKVYNKGMFLNLFDEKPGLVKILSAFVTILITIYQLITLLRRGNCLKKAGLSLMTAGAWSNTFDRWFRGYVIDYVGIQTKWKKASEITYNLGDFFIMAGSIFMMLSSLFPSKKK
ncbi:signal peptidase II [Faecalicatena contorta]|uniref:Lipoprotein signal peptidase n=1 Tax=Faecalicatena contorta TaxID=39482 RepID=A0A316A1R8_9FIRM|nr:signal peptidase II [Faecalicatena contorta]PWJ51585.1 signal peptidase II [Faecalicatena contorta]SUQ13141.1 signal peptidase II [Faecalicatena contorta]